jgi:pheromone shutdown protein TraB
MITLIGVGHVFDLAGRLRSEILARTPGLVCIELDRGRFEALLERDKPQAAGVPVMYQMLAAFQQRMAEQYGTQVGDEMLAAAETARELKAGLAFIDLDASQVFSEFWGGMSLKEKVKLMVASFMGIFAGRRSVEKEVEHFEQNPQDYIEAFSKEFPTAKRILIDKRDEHMAQKLRELQPRFEKIVAVVGDGHINGMGRLLADLKPEVVRLSELRRGPDIKVVQDEGTYTYSFKG